jgi:hypothetical protein
MSDRPTQPVAGDEVPPPIFELRHDLCGSLQAAAESTAAASRGPTKKIEAAQLARLAALIGPDAWWRLHTRPPGQRVEPMHGGQTLCSLRDVHDVGAVHYPAEDHLWLSIDATAEVDWAEVRGCLELDGLILSGPCFSERLPDLSGVAVPHLCLFDWRCLRGLAGLEEIPGLEALTISNCRELRDLDALEAVPGLQELSLIGRRGIEPEGIPVRDLEVIAKLGDLRVLRLRGLQEACDPSPIGLAPALEHLEIGDGGLRRLPVFGEGAKLRVLDAELPVVDLRGLANAVELRSLRVDFVPDHRSEPSEWGACSLAPLSHLRHLRDLTFIGSSSVADLAALATCPSLTRLEILADTHLDDLEPLRACAALAELSIGVMGSVDLEPLSSLPRLTKLGLVGGEEVSLAPLAHFPRLEELALCVRSTGLGVLADCKHLKALEVDVSDHRPRSERLPRGFARLPLEEKQPVWDRRRELCEEADRETIEQFLALSGLERLTLHWPWISGERLAALARLPRLEELMIYLEVSEEHPPLAHIESSPTLRDLFVGPFWQAEAVAAVARVAAARGDVGLVKERIAVWTGAIMAAHDARPVRDALEEALALGADERWAVDARAALEAAWLERVEAERRWGGGEEESPWESCLDC